MNFIWIRSSIELEFDAKGYRWEVAIVVKLDVHEMALRLMGYCQSAFAKGKFVLRPWCWRLFLICLTIYFVEVFYRAFRVQFEFQEGSVLSYS